MAVLPGLLAYPSEELFESGVNIEELCKVPEELTSALTPDSESEGEGGAASGSAAAAADCLSSGKRQREAEALAAGGASPSASGCGADAAGSASSGGAAHAAAAAVKRLRTDASSPTSFAGYAPVALAAGTPQPSPAALAVAAAEVAAAVCPRMVPVEVPTPVAVPPLAPPVPLPSPSMGAAFFRNRGRPAGAPRLRPLPRVEAPPPPPSAPVAHTPSKPVTRQKNHSPATGVAGEPEGASAQGLHQPTAGPHVLTAAAAGAPGGAYQRGLARPPPHITWPHAMPRPLHPCTPPLLTPRAPTLPCLAVAPRTSGRRTVMQWHTENVVDPRTGATVSEVQPGTFCTQVRAPGLHFESARHAAPASSTRQGQRRCWAALAWGMRG